MSELKDRSAYFVSRHAEEIVAAEAATTDKARIVHLELALRYSLLAAQHRGFQRRAKAPKPAAVTPAQ
jgi:hypothetical protein